MSKFVYKNPERKQKETAYILYMIISSCFKKSICKSALMEQQLYMYYQEMPNEMQISSERRIIDKVEKELKNYLPLFQEMNCVVRLMHTNPGEYEVHFLTGFEHIVACVNDKNQIQIRIFH